MKYYIEGNTYPIKDAIKSLGCRWDGTRKAWYTEDEAVATKARALLKPHPIYNSPPPEDLGTVDPAAMAAKFGRKAVEGAKVGSFTGYGDKPTPLGTIVHFKKQGKRRVKVANGKPRYYSRDMLEDFDMFDSQPGYQYRWDGVEVEPTEAELAEDAAEQAKVDAVVRAKEAMKAAEETIKKGDVIGRQQVDTYPGSELGSIDLEEQLNYSTYVQGDRFILTSSQIWFVEYNGRDGDNWSWNNLPGGSIGWAMPYDAALAGQILSAAKLLNYRKKTNKGEPARTRIETDHGSVEQYGYHGVECRITYKPDAPIGSHKILTDGRYGLVEGIHVVQFNEKVKDGKKLSHACARIDTRPELAALVELGKVLAAELKAHYSEES